MSGVKRFTIEAESQYRATDIECAIPAKYTYTVNALPYSYIKFLTFDIDRKNLTAYNPWKSPIETHEQT